ncbi:MAG: GGDEF domain-containing protein [Thermoleophilia bacterium]|nr:GGDEF domain-containing protein [Thermoleophilia bacterium]
MAAQPEAPPTGQARLLRLTGQDVAMGWILAVMILFGVAVGVVFPHLVSSLVTLRPGEQGAFRMACIGAGFCVGGFAYGVARFTLFRANRRLACLAAYDGLTGLFNQRQFARSLSTELMRAQRCGRPATLIITDLDHFKSVNDHHGHTIGDDVLAAVAADVAASVRPFDVACRIGGEEFAVILPSSDREEGLAVAERIRARVARSDRGGLPAVTISCGVASYPEDGEAIRELVRHADDAMYAAKAAGRNTVRAWAG